VHAQPTAAKPLVGEVVARHVKLVPKQKM
jgi:hypothetical protein